MQEQEISKKNRKFDFKNLTREQKEKGVAFIFVGLVVSGFFIYGISNYGSEEDGAVDDFTNPTSELSQYNNKTDAINQKEFTNTDDGNLEMQFKENNFPKTEELSFKDLDEQIASANSGNTAPTRNVQPSNSHNVYGNYDMWQADEPRNNSVGYTNRSVSISKPKEITKTNNSTPNYTEIQPNKTQPYQEPIYQEQASLKMPQQGKQIRAKLLSQGYISSGRSLSFVLLEPTKINGETIPKGQTITGTSYEENNRLMANFTSIKIKNKVISVQMQLLGTDGIAGLPIAGTNNNAGSEVENRSRSLARDQINRIPVIGGVIGALGSGTKQPDNRIKLPANVECIIVNYN